MSLLFFEMLSSWILCVMCQIHLIEPKPRKDEVKKENVLCDAHHLLEVNNGIIFNLNHETFSRKGTELR